jgi:hypothetical protein
MDNEYCTKDLGVAAMLIATGHTMRAMTWKDKIAFFSFDDPETCNRLQHLFLFGQVMVPAKAYYEAIKALKIEIIRNQNERR